MVMPCLAAGDGAQCDAGEADVLGVANGHHVVADLDGRGIADHGRR